VYKGDPPPWQAAWELEAVGVKQSSSTAILLCASSTAKETKSDMETMAGPP
ncbi:unnamed protein product, partial [Urochloa humidicola]